MNGFPLWMFLLALAAVGFAGYGLGRLAGFRTLEHRLLRSLEEIRRAVSR